MVLVNITLMNISVRFMAESNILIDIYGKRDVYKSIMIPRVLELKEEIKAWSPISAYIKLNDRRLVLRYVFERNNVVGEYRRIETLTNRDILYEYSIIYELVDSNPLNVKITYLANSTVDKLIAEMKSRKSSVKLADNNILNRVINTISKRLSISPLQLATTKTAIGNYYFVELYLLPHSVELHVENHRKHTEGNISITYRDNSEETIKFLKNTLLLLEEGVPEIRGGKVRPWVFTAEYNPLIPKKMYVSKDTRLTVMLMGNTLLIRRGGIVISDSINTSLVERMKYDITKPVLISNNIRFLREVSSRKEHDFSVVLNS